MHCWQLAAACLLRANLLPVGGQVGGSLLQRARAFLLILTPPNSAF